MAGDPSRLQILDCCEPASGPRLQGTVGGVLDGSPAEVRYRVDCDWEWRTRRVEVAVRGQEGRRTLALESDGAGRWLDDLGWWCATPERSTGWPAPTRGEAGEGVTPWGAQLG